MKLLLSTSLSTAQFFRGLKVSGTKTLWERVAAVHPKPLTNKGSCLKILQTLPDKGCQHQCLGGPGDIRP